jgi:hypothetical protein
LNPHLPAYEAGALTVMLRCFKYRVRLELTINGFARQSGLEGFPHKAIAEGADHRLNQLGYRCKKSILYLIFKVHFLALSINNRAK